MQSGENRAAPFLLGGDEMARAFVRIALLSVALTACSVTVETPVDDELTLAEFISLFGDTTCRRSLYCTQPPERTAWWQAAPELSCEEVASPDPYRWVLEQLAARGTVTFDATAAARCLDALERTCTLELASHADCERTIVGTVPVGADCLWQDECVPGTYCSIGSCTGTCTPLPIEGAPCDALACDLCDADVACAYVVETVVRNAGEECGSMRGEDGRWLRADCSGELICRQHSCTDFNCPPTCELLPREGADCDPDERPSCMPPFACLDNRCTRIVVETAEGAPCDGNGVTCDRFHGLVCEGGSCVRIGGGVGARCESAAIDCEPGLNCATGECVVPLANGEPCYISDDCASHSCWAARCDTRDTCP